ncbi:MAG: GntR family transcriptional regulator [Ideonella sp.]|nr:GntR family transcriptional regulator [Ideonella sp.]
MGRFLPGERLKIRNVATDLGVGQMPVRAALQRLAAEGALVNIPNAGVTVPRLSVAEFDDLLQMRMLLEGEAAERGALRLLRRRSRARCTPCTPAWTVPCNVGM